MFNLYKNIINKNIDRINKIENQFISIGIRKSILFDMPEIANITKPKKENDSVFSPYKYIFVEGIYQKTSIGTFINFQHIEEIIKTLPKEDYFKKLLKQKCEYILTMIFFKQIPGQASLCPFRLFLQISKKGNIIKEETVDYEDNTVKRNKSDWFEKKTIKKGWIRINQMIDSHRDWTLSFLRLINLPNIKTKSIPAFPKDIKYFKKQKTNQTHYYILTVEKPTYTKSKPQNQNSKETSMPLHQVRGHLADYTEGKGLFGKYKIRLWIPDHWRGDLQYGTIKKDYKLK